MRGSHGFTWWEQWDPVKCQYKSYKHSWSSFTSWGAGKQWWKLKIILRKNSTKSPQTCAQVQFLQNARLWQCCWCWTIPSHNEQLSGQSERSYHGYPLYHHTQRLVQCRCPWQGGRSKVAEQHGTTRIMRITRTSVIRCATREDCRPSWAILWDVELATTVHQPFTSKNHHLDWKASDNKHQKRALTSHVRIACMNGIEWMYWWCM